ncbi:MAG TPA: ABC transporter permease [Thermoanaerobaculia bacterium]|nr:ABC transporter permease [Thermoanaerobaculia bacterium]
MVLTVVIFGVSMIVGRMAGRDDTRIRNVAVIGSDVLPVADAHQASATDTIRLIPHDASDEAKLREQVRNRDLDGLLIIRNPDNAELHVRSEGRWSTQVKLLLTAARQQFMTERAGLTPAVVAAILTPPNLEITREMGGSAKSERLSLIIVIAIMLMTVFTGMAYIFTSITGEKQNRVTEQIVSAIPAQAWLDGKILGLLGVSIVGVASQVVAFAAVGLAMRLWGGAGPLPLPTTLGNPVVVLTIVIFAVLGLAFWFAFLGLIAAVIDDPNSSTRSSFLFLPVFVTGFAFAVLPDPTTTLSRVLSLLPVTSPSAMPARLMAGEVPAWEVATALLLLAAGAWLLRIAAGRVLRIGMLMYGKEPSWAEVRRWALRG